MKIIFAGTPEISAAVLEALIAAKYNIVACLTQPDRPKGRGQQLTASPVKLTALQHNIPVLQPASLKSAEVQQQLRDLQADLMIVLAYGLILPQIVLDIPKRGCVNIHASLLPRWRGAAPIQHAILAGDTETGITIMQMDAGLDTGDILHLYRCPIAEDETSASLYTKLTALGCTAITDVLRQQKLARTPQNNTLASYAPKLSKQEGLIDWHEPAITIDRKIRAYNPWPVAFTHINDMVLRIWRAQLIDEDIAITPPVAPGTIINCDQYGIVVATGRGSIRLLEVQLPSKAITSAAALAKPHHALRSGARFE